MFFIPTVKSIDVSAMPNGEKKPLMSVGDYANIHPWDTLTRKHKKKKKCKSVAIDFPDKCKYTKLLKL